MALGHDVGLEEVVGMTLRGLVGKFSYKSMRCSDIIDEEVAKKKGKTSSRRMMSRIQY